MGNLCTSPVAAPTATTLAASTSGHAGTGSGEPRKPNVMFICTHNAARSQMAEAYARQRLLNQGIVGSVQSCGLNPTQFHKLAKEQLEAEGLDVSKQYSKHIDEFNATDFDIVISLCGCGANLPKQWLEKPWMFQDWDLTDPETLGDKEGFAMVAGLVKEKVEGLVSDAEYVQQNIN